VLAKFTFVGVPNVLLAPFGVNWTTHAVKLVDDDGANHAPKNIQ
jgi:hypothetical protein